MTTQTIIEILNISLPFVSAILLFYLSSHREDFVSQKETYQERLNCLYVPFYKIYCRGLMNQIPFSDFSLESRGKVLDLFSNNIQFMDSMSQSYYFDFYNSNLNLIDAEDNEDIEKIKIYKSELDAIFKELSKSMFAEYKHLLRKLNCQYQKYSLNFLILSSPSKKPHTPEPIVDKTRKSILLTLFPFLYLKIFCHVVKFSYPK